ncbi:hypothetical protein BGZ72_006217 [Mortierella alpina]|nr:hypothetical protein BGZ72_006217 [Mortierella alpina]
MGTAVSRDHAKLPFGYTHARKDHSFNTSSVSRRRLATRLLRTPDTTSVTPFPIQDGASSVASIPELVSLPPIPLNFSLHLHEPPSSSSHHSLPAPLPSTPSYSYSSPAPAAAGPSYHSYSYSYGYDHGHSAGMAQSSISVPDSGTGATAGTIATSSTVGAVPESESGLETAIRSSRSRNLTGNSLSHSRSFLHPHSYSHSHVHHKASMTAAGDHSYGHNSSSNNNNNNNNNPGQSSSPAGSSLGWTSTHQHHTGMTNPNLVQAQAATTSTAASPGSLAHIPSAALNGPSSSTRYEQEPYSSIQKQRQSQLFRSQEEQNNDMDIISALGIADRPFQGSYDFFTTTPSPPRSSSLQQQQPSLQAQAQSQQYYHHSATLSKRDSMALLLASSSRMVGQEDYETRTSICAVASEDQGRHRRALSYELNDDDYVDVEDEGALKLEADSILDEDLENLSPIPFSDLPSLTNIGLCSHGIVKLSSNIRLLASATCVQICCNELSRIPVEIGFLRNLTLLDLSKNSLTCLPDSIKYLTKLVDLKLSFNQLETIPSGIGGLTKLAALSLDNNRLESIPPQIGLIKGLVNLDLSDNPITVLPAEVGKLQFLRRLKLDRCPLVEEFVHSPLHSPPTLLELAARVIVRHDVSVPPMISPHLKSYLKSARKCTFCEGPYFDSSVKRGKMIEKNDIFIPLEYTLCQPHWNTELERVKLLFCQRPVTAPPLKTSAASGPQPQRPAGGGGQTSAKRQQPKAASPTATAALLSPASGSSSAPGASGSEAVPTAEPLATTADNQPFPTVRPRRAKNAQEGGERERPLSMFGNRLSMLLKLKGERRERPASTFLTTTTSPLSATPGTGAATPSSPGPPASPSSSTTVSAAVDSARPRTRRSVTSTFFKRAGLKMARPLSLGSALDGPELMNIIPAASPHALSGARLA